MAEKPGFIKDRLNSLQYAVKGAFILIRTENAIKVHLICALILTVIGFLLRISLTEWMFQIFAFGLILSVESLNTAIEKICDFIHPDFHHKIGFIKDISAGAVTFAVITGYTILLLIYLS